MLKPTPELIVTKPEQDRKVASQPIYPVIEGNHHKEPYIRPCTQQVARPVITTDKSNVKHQDVQFSG